MGHRRSRCSAGEGCGLGRTAIEVEVPRRGPSGHGAVQEAGQAGVRVGRGPEAARTLPNSIRQRLPLDATGRTSLVAAGGMLAPLLLVALPPLPVRARDGSA